MLSRFAGTLAVALGLFAIAAPPASANLISNGDFETGNFSGWTVTPPDGNVVVLSGSDYQPCCGTTGTGAELSNHFASFGPGNIAITGVTIGQTFSTIAGQTYNFSFNYGALGGGSEQLQFEIITGASQQILTAVANDDLDHVFQSMTGTFIASSSTTIKFGDLGGLADTQANNVDFILDNISVTAVPEPSTWAMLLLGFAGLGFIGFRRRNKMALSNA
jgi:hypothetical protein